MVISLICRMAGGSCPGPSTGPDDQLDDALWIWRYAMVELVTSFSIHRNT